MKRILCGLTILSMVVLLSGCGGKVTPKEALTNTSNAKQGKMIMSVKLTANTANKPEEIKVLFDSVFGASEDNKIIGAEGTLKANYQGMLLEGKMDVNADLSGKEPKISLEAGVPASTLTTLGISMPSAVVITLSADDFTKLLKDQKLDLNSTMDAEGIKRNAETLAKILKAFNDLKIDEPKDAGNGTMSIEGSTFEGEKYTAHITDSQAKSAIKAIVKIGLDLEKTSLKNDATSNKLSIPTQQEIDTQLDETFKSLTLKDGINATMMIDKDGYFNYLGFNMGMKDPSSSSEVALDIALGYSDLNSSVKGLDYYNKNKTGMYKDATTIPIMQYLEGALNSSQTGSSSSLFGTSNKK